MFARSLFIFAMSTFALAAVYVEGSAQETELDPRIAQATIKAAQTLLALRETELVVAHETLKRREAEWAKYSEPLWKAE